MLNWFRWLPENVSTYGGDIDAVFALVYYLTLGWLVLTFGTIGWFLVRYRRGGGRPAAHVRGERLGEVAWILVPVALVLVLDFWIDLRGAPAWARVKVERPPAALTIRVTGKQFNWEVVYPGPDGRFDTADDRTFENELHVPVGQAVRLELRARDVIHSFFVPNLRLKQDVVPGRVIEAWFEATKPGEYEIPCAMLCGFGHSGMKGVLYVETPEAHARWRAEQWPS
jgi:cytochrome c oxidase subunit 2